VLTCQAEAGEVDKIDEESQSLGGNPPVTGQVEGHHVGERRQAHHAQVVQLPTAVLGAAPPQIQSRQSCDKVQPRISSCWSQGTQGKLDVLSERLTCAREPYLDRRASSMFSAKD
jgi:hypothetical protein